MIDLTLIAPKTGEVQDISINPVLFKKGEELMLAKTIKEVFIQLGLYEENEEN